MKVIADGFMKSSLNSCDKYIEDNWHKDADIVIYPMLFNVNHAIELYLKSLTWSLNILLDNSRRIEGNHNIKQIFEVMMSRIQEFEAEGNHIILAVKFENLKDYINEFFEKIETCNENGRRVFAVDSTRYPFSQKYENHFYIDEFDNVPVDLENFKIRFTEIGDNLSNLVEYYLDIIDRKSENE